MKSLLSKFVDLDLNNPEEISKLIREEFMGDADLFEHTCCCMLEGLKDQMFRRSMKLAADWWECNDNIMIETSEIVRNLNRDIVYDVADCGFNYKLVANTYQAELKLRTAGKLNIGN